jgi:galactose mutarotase-like enzyme
VNIAAQLSAAIDPQGAQLSMLRDPAGNDLLWHGDPAFWSGRAPILFPIVGALNQGRYLWRGQHYALPRHGFARGRRFDVVHHTASEALFRQTHDTETLKVYPFRFELDVLFRMEGSAIFIQATVRNIGDEAMPASIGFHPALRWPLPNSQSRDAHYIEFECDEPAPVRRLDANGLLTDVRHATPVIARRLALHDDLFKDDVVIFDQLASRRLTYGAATGSRIAVSFPDATHLGLWTKPGAGFICIEPWRGVADPVGFTGELQHKPGVFSVAPGDSQSLSMHLELLVDTTT